MSNIPGGHFTLCRIYECPIYRVTNLRSGECTECRIYRVSSLLGVEFTECRIYRVSNLPSVEFTGGEFTGGQFPSGEFTDNLFNKLRNRGMNCLKNMVILQINFDKRAKAKSTY